MIRRRTAASRILFALWCAAVGTAPCQSSIFGARNTQSLGQSLGGRNAVWGGPEKQPETYGFGRVFVFMHVFAVNHVVDVVKTEVDAMYNSGLYTRADAIYVFLAWQEGSHTTRDEVLTFFKDQGAKFVISQITNDNSRYERITLEAIPRMVRDDDAVLYLHSKGVSHGPGDALREHMATWTDVMLFHLVGHWETCLQALQGSDALGINFLMLPKPHFSGNFWWTTGAHIRSLPLPIGPDYFDTEMWICRKARVKRLNWNFAEETKPGIDSLMRWPARREYIDRTDFVYEGRTIREGL